MAIGVLLPNTNKSEGSGMLSFILNPIISYCYKKNYVVAARILGDIKNEPANYLYLALTYPLGWLPWFNFYGVNPSKLSDRQAKEAAVLYIPGFQANQSSTLKIAKEFQKDSHCAVFTLNLQNKILYCEQDFLLIEQKILALRKLYAKHGNDEVIIHLIGHSRGATVAYYVSIEPNHWKLNQDEQFELIPEIKDNIKSIKYRKEIGKVAFFGGGRVPYGYNSKELVKSKFICIEGRKDNRSSLDEEHTVHVENSHATTIYHPIAIAETLQFFKKAKNENLLSGPIELSEDEPEIHNSCVIM